MTPPHFGSTNQYSEIQTSVPAGSRSNSGIKSASARWMQPHEAGWPMDCLVAGAVDVNIAVVRIHIAAVIETRLQPFQPQDARGDFGVGKFRLRRVADGFARFENGPRRFAAADFFRDAMQAQRRAVGAFDLPDAKARGGTAEMFSRNLPSSNSESLWLEMRTAKIYLVGATLRRSHVAATVSGNILRFIKRRLAQPEINNRRARQKTAERASSSRYGLVSFFTSTLEFRPLCSYFSRRAGGKSSGVPSPKPPLD